MLIVWSMLLLSWWQRKLQLASSSKMIKELLFLGSEVYLPTAHPPHGLRGRVEKALLSHSALDVALAATAMSLQTYTASNKKNLLCTSGLTGVLEEVA